MAPCQEVKMMKMPSMKNLTMTPSERWCTSRRTTAEGKRLGRMKKISTWGNTARSNMTTGKTIGCSIRTWITIYCRMYSIHLWRKSVIIRFKGQSKRFRSYWSRTFRSLQHPLSTLTSSECWKMKMWGRTRRSVCVWLAGSSSQNIRRRCMSHTVTRVLAMVRSKTRVPSCIMPNCFITWLGTESYFYSDLNRISFSIRKRFKSWMWSHMILKLVGTIVETSKGSLLSLHPHLYLLIWCQRM